MNQETSACALGLMLLGVALGAACAGGEPAPPVATPPVQVAPAPSAEPPAPVASAAASAEAPCTPVRPGHVVEGAAVLNASPDDLPYQVLPFNPKTKAHEPMPPRAKLTFDDAKGAPPAAVDGAFKVWHESGIWHVHAVGKGAKAGTLYQVRVAGVSEPQAENGSPALRLIANPRLAPGRCWDDPPKSDATRMYAGFELEWDGKARGMSFKAPPGTECIALTMRVGSKQELPAVSIGASGKHPKADKPQDTIEFCP